VTVAGVKGVLTTGSIGLVEITSGGTPGPELADEWRDLDNNVYGTLPGERPYHVAEQLVNAGWRARASTWTDYEVEREWVGLELAEREGDVLLSGVVDPARLADLAAVFENMGVRYELELWNAERTEIIRQLRWSGVDG
jgi:hypothetical protein